VSARKIGDKPGRSGDNSIIQEISPLMAKRSTRRTRPPLFEDPMAFPLLVGLVAVVVILGVLQYWLLLALGSAIYLAFLGWRHSQRKPTPRRAARPRGRKKTSPKRQRARPSARR
jgi:type IV secretory pathway TrbD component